MHVDNGSKRQGSRGSDQVRYPCPLLCGRAGAVLPLHAQLACIILEGTHALGDVLAGARGHAQAGVVAVLDVLRLRIVLPDRICRQTGRSAASNACSPGVDTSGMRSSHLCVLQQTCRSGSSMVRETTSPGPDRKPGHRGTNQDGRGGSRAIARGKGLDHRVHSLSNVRACLTPGWTVLQPTHVRNAERRVESHLDCCRVRDRWIGRCNRSRSRTAPHTTAPQQTPTAARSAHSIDGINAVDHRSRRLQSAGSACSAAATTRRLEDPPGGAWAAPSSSAASLRYCCRWRPDAAQIAGPEHSGGPVLRILHPPLRCWPCWRRTGVPHRLLLSVAGGIGRLCHGWRQGAGDQPLQGPALAPM